MNWIMNGKLIIWSYFEQMLRHILQLAKIWDAKKAQKVQFYAYFRLYFGFSDVGLKNWEEKKNI